MLRQQLPQLGETVAFMREPYILLMILQVDIPPHAGWPTGTYVTLWKPTWPKCQFVVVPLKDLDATLPLVA